MEKTIQILITQKIREALMLCGINDSVDDPLKQHIMQISDLVHKARLEAGIQGPLESATLEDSPAAPFEARRSYRLLSSGEKQGRICFKGLTGSSAKKRGKGKKGSRNNKTGEGPLSKDGHTGGTGEPPGQVSDQRVDTATSTNRIAHPFDSELRRASPSRPPDHLPPGASSTAGGMNLELPLESPRAIEKFCLSSGTSLPVPQELFVQCLLESVPAMKVMTSILWDCVKLNLTIGKYGRQTKLLPTTTEIENIRQYADDIGKLEYPEAVRVIKKDNALLAGRDIQSRYSETVYWEIIQKGARLLDPTKLRTAMGPPDGFSVSEKEAATRFMEEAGYGTSRENQRQYRHLWKSLFEMRTAGVDKILLYRTKEFDSYCKGYAKNSEISLLDTVVSWEKIYGLQIGLLENRVMKVSEGDFTGRTWLNQPDVAARLEVQESSWNDSANEWFSTDEEASFKLTVELREILTDHLGGLSDDGHITEGGRNKSFFVSLLPKDDKLLSVCPIIPVHEGDFLGVFAGMIRFSENFLPAHGIRGPAEKLWLDYSQVTGMLNQMRVSQLGGDANVCLQWELVNGQNETELGLSWRVSIRAIRTIMPFEEIIRAAPQKEQYLLHRSSVYARGGFMKDSGLCN